MELMQQLSLSLSGTNEFDPKQIADRLCDLIASRIRVAPPVVRRPTRAASLG